MCLHRASIGVSTLTPRDDTSGVCLAIHHSISALVVTASARSLPAIYPFRLDCIPFSFVAVLNSVCREPSAI